MAKKATKKQLSAAFAWRVRVSTAAEYLRYIDETDVLTLERMAVQHRVRCIKTWARARIESILAQCTIEQILFTQNRKLYRQTMFAAQASIKALEARGFDMRAEGYVLEEGIDLQEFFGPSLHDQVRVAEPKQRPKQGELVW